MAKLKLAADKAGKPGDRDKSYDADADYVARLVQFYEDAEEATQDARKAAERDRDYYDGIQLTATEKKNLDDRGQPDVIMNRIQRKVDYLLGWEAASRTDPKAVPRTPADEEGAEVATDGLRYVKDVNALDQKFSTTWENMIVEGFGGIELVVDEATAEISAVEWDWDRLFYDPHARKHDFSDARYLGGVIWMDAEDAQAKWPDQADAIEQTVSSEAEMSRTYADRPTWKTWVIGKGRKRVRVVQMYHREGAQWKWCIFTRGAKLDGGDVAFVDQDNRSFCPLYLQSTYVDRSNNRYGLVRSMISAQDEVNKRRSKALHLLSVKQVIAEEGAVDDVDAARAELAKPDGWIRKNPGFELEVISDIPNLTGHLNLLQEAKNEIDLLGPNSAMQGKQGESASGRAILASQQGGQTELTRIVDRHRNLKRRVYEGIWYLVRQYKRDEWWVRVTDDEDKIKFVGFNKPVTMLDDLRERAAKSGMAPEEVEAGVAEMQADPIRGQMLGQVVRIANQPAQMNMDITLEEVPDVANVAEEQFQGLIKLAPAVTFPPEVYLEASSLRNKKQLIEKLKAPEPDPVATEFQVKTAAATLAKLEAEVRKIEAETLNKLVDADVKALPLNQIVRPAVVDAGAEPQMLPDMMSAGPGPMPGAPQVEPAMMGAGPEGPLPPEPMPPAF
jgi:hypothetical protein